MNVLVTGATGYVGGRLTPRLLERGHRVRVLVRDPDRIQGRPWVNEVEVVHGDLLEPETLAAAFEGIEAAYYLVHSMTGRKDFEQTDRRAAENFSAGANGQMRHVIYLGGLQPQNTSNQSPHLRSRAEVGQILRNHLPTTEFRAGPIIGSGSASFEMVRYLTERLPTMVAPKWIRNDVQPIAVRDVMNYLLEVLGREPMGIVSIGAERLSFKAMMQGYAKEHGLRRLILPVPVLAPKLAARWVGFVTPIPNKLAIPLVEGVVHPLLLPDDRAVELFPEIKPIPYQRAVNFAMNKVEHGDVETRWSGALGEGPSRQLYDWEGMIRERQIRAVDADPERIYHVFSSLGGSNGWLTWNWAWTLRGMMDRIVGGPGLRRGRRDPEQLLPGEALDWWRVEVVERPTMLRLRAEMKVPGRAWLQWETQQRDGQTWLVQTALFRPRGLPGVLYWYLLYPIHKLIFTSMAKAIAERAESKPD